MVGKEAPDSRRAVLAGLLACRVLADCGAGVDAAVLGEWTPQQIDSIYRARLSALNPEALAEGFALWSDAATVQCETVEQELVGSVVEWEIEVYDVALVEGVVCGGAQGGRGGPAQFPAGILIEHEHVRSLRLSALINRFACCHSS